MIVGKVVGSLISTRKSTNLIGNKFMIIEPLPEMHMKAGNIVAIDNIGAGSAARIGTGSPESPIDAAVVVIVDDENDLKIYD